MNDSRHPDPRRDLANELAELLAQPDGARTARLLQALDLLTPPKTSAFGMQGSGGRAQPVSGSRALPEGRESFAASRDGLRLDTQTLHAGGPHPIQARPIQIWHPRHLDGELVFERPTPSPLGDHYATRRRISAKKPEGSRRIVLLGESAAAGYLYAPHHTPATVLQALLGDANEVIDLARTNERLGPLVETARAATQLAPDVFVVFAGNNWNLLETPEISVYAPSVSARQRVAQTLRRGGIRGLVAVARRQLNRVVTRGFAQLAAVAEGAGARVLVVVPEVNLADWESPQPIPWLSESGTIHWHALHIEAIAALEDGNPQAAEAAAVAMLEIETAADCAGVCGTAWRLIARARHATGDLDAAADAASREIDASPYAALAFLGAPQADRRVQDLLRRTAARHSFTTIDLPRLFAADTPYPGRELFLDYCHLSAAGIEKAMHAVASSLGTDAETRVEPSRPAAAVEALARLGAAVHGAHRLLTTGAKRPALTAWCREALRQDPTLASTFLNLAAARTAACPELLSSAQARELAKTHRLLLAHGWRWDHLDAELLEAMATALDNELPDLAGGTDIMRMLVERHGVEQLGDADLVRAPYLWEPLEQLYPDAMRPAERPGSATLRSPWPSTRFVLVTDGTHDLEISCVARLPPIPGAEGLRAGEIVLEVGDVEVLRCEIGERWHRATTQLTSDVLQQGVNCLTLKWPMPPPVGEAALDAAIHRLEQGLEADLHPIFGEVASLRARVP